MSIVRIAVEAHARKTGLSLREIMQAAYLKKYGKVMPERSLAEDVRRWQAGGHVAYLYDFMLNTQGESHE